ncbi:MAG: hypothetical protein WB799_05815 [Candidatus Sulfotelmatobacter sp.]
MPEYVTISIGALWAPEHRPSRPSDHPVILGRDFRFRRRRMATATAPAIIETACDKLSHPEFEAQAELNRTKGFLGGTLGEITAAAPPSTLSLAEIQAMTDEVLVLAGEQAMADIGDNLLVLDELRQRFRKGIHFKGYEGWSNFVSRNSRYSLKTIQRRLQEVNGKDESKVNINPGNQYTRPTPVSPEPGVPCNIHGVPFKSTPHDIYWVPPANPPDIKGWSLMDAGEKHRAGQEAGCDYCLAYRSARSCPTHGWTEKGNAHLGEMKRAMEPAAPAIERYAEKDYFARIGRGLAAAFSGVDARLAELVRIKKSEWTPEAEEGIRCLILNLKEVSEKADGYATSLRAVLKQKRRHA